MSSKKIVDIIKSAKKLQNSYKKSLSVKSPKPDKLPYPIYLEHTHKIVGWGNIPPIKDKLLVSPLEITDSATKQKMQKGEIKGLSVGGIVKQSECSICKQDYTKCNHIAGKRYGSKKCTNYITAIDLVEISLVKEPVNPEAIIKLKTNQWQNQG